MFAKKNLSHVTFEEATNIDQPTIEERHEGTPFTVISYCKKVGVPAQKPIGAFLYPSGSDNKAVGFEQVTDFLANFRARSSGLTYAQKRENAINLVEHVRDSLIKDIKGFGSTAFWGHQTEIKSLILTIKALQTCKCEKGDRYFEALLFYIKIIFSRVKASSGDQAEQPPVSLASPQVEVAQQEHGTAQQEEPSHEPRDQRDYEEEKEVCRSEERTLTEGDRPRDLQVAWA